MTEPDLNALRDAARGLRSGLSRDIDDSFRAVSSSAGYEEPPARATPPASDRIATERKGAPGAVIFFFGIIALAMGIWALPHFSQSGPSCSQEDRYTRAAARGGD